MDVYWNIQSLLVHYEERTSCTSVMHEKLHTTTLLLFALPINYLSKVFKASWSLPGVNIG